MISSQQLRTLFFEYFTAKNHQFIPSHSLIPLEDKTLLFTNAGMVPFKSRFLNKTSTVHPNAVSIQRCLRAGGKHNDLDNVGYTARHHTFFEMMGNFSFGSYSKREAIQLAWNFLTDVLKLPPERLWVTVFHEDKEAEKIWLEEINVNPTRFSRCDVKENFWSMGDTGPCGPCSEIFYDHGATIAGGPPGSTTADGDRYVEIWNLVFMEYERTSEGSLVPLAKPCIDTGMGLERLTAVMQGVTSNYDTDLFKPLIQTAKAEIASHTENSIPTHTLQVIADHVRAISFLIFDGVIPGNEGRAYVLRRIIRRALRHGYQVGVSEAFLHKLVPAFCAQMQPVYPELKTHQADIVKTLLQEEQQFLQTLHQGMKYFEKIVAKLQTHTLPGELVFTLYDTYGFPADLTADLAREKGLDWDRAGFENAMKAQQQRSQAANKFSQINTLPTLDLSTEFCRDIPFNETTHIIGLLNKSHQPVNHLSAGETGSIILEKTPFYAEAGGQIGDQGELHTLSKEPAIFTVEDTQKKNTLHLHTGIVQQGSLQLHDHVQAHLNIARRQAIARHHSATHLLHAALREQLGPAVTQKGSLVTDAYLRFDFSYANKLEQDSITQLEQRINQLIWENIPVTTEIMTLDAAKASGAMALFTEKYDSEVRVLKIANFSTELCGGTHVHRTGEIGLFKITELTTIASGVKRIEAVAGEAAFKWLKIIENQQFEIANLLKTNSAQIVTRLQKQTATIKQQAEEINRLQTYLCQSFSKALLSRVVQLGELNLIVTKIPSLMSSQARVLIDQVKSKFTAPLIVVLGCALPDKIQVSIGISKNYTNQVKATELVDLLSPIIQGKGGGRPDFAHIQAENNDAHQLQVALKAIKPWLKKHFSS